MPLAFRAPRAPRVLTLLAAVLVTLGAAPAVRAHGDHPHYAEVPSVAQRLLPRAVAPRLAGPLVRLPRERYYLANDDHTDYMWSGLDSTYRSCFVRMIDYSMDLADATAGNPWDARARFVMDGSMWVSEYEASQPLPAFARLAHHLQDSTLVMPLNACVQNWGAMPAEAVLRSFYAAGRYERRLGIRIPLVIPMENQTLPGGVGSLWAGSGARYAWKGICDCGSCFVASDRALDAYSFTGHDGQSVLLKWNTIYDGNMNVGGYAEARNPAAALGLMRSNPVYRTRWPYGVHGAFGYGHDDLQSFTTAFVDAALNLSDDTTRVIASNELDFFRDFENLYGAVLPTYGKAFGNEWDLLCSTLAKPTAEYKTSVEQLRTAEALAALVVQQDTTFMQGRAADRDSAMLACGLYVEHSWSGGPGVTPEQRTEWQRQIARAITRYSDGLQSDGLVRLGQLVARPTTAERHAVFNPLSWTRTDVVDLVSAVAEPRRVVDVTTGAELPSQSVSVDGQPRLRVRVAGVPSVGYRVVEVPPGAGATFPPAATVSGATLAGSLYSLTMGAHGQVTSLVDHKDGDRQLVTAGGGLHDMEQGAGVAVAENVGPVSATLRVVSPGAPDHDVRVTLYSGIDRVDVDARITENFNTLQEARYDFDVPGGKFRHEEVGMIARAAYETTGGDYAEQNARTDWLTGNHFVDLSNDSRGVTLSTWDGMFWAPGDSWVFGLDTTQTFLRVLIGNAGGCTSGLYDQGEDSSFRDRYSLRTHGAWSAPAAMRFALEHQNPLVDAPVTSSPGAGVLPAGAYSAFAVDTSDVILWALKPAEEGPARALVARLWNLADAPRTALLASPVWALLDPRRVTHIETDLGPATGTGNGVRDTYAREQMKTFRFLPYVATGDSPAASPAAVRLAVWPNPARGEGARTLAFTLPASATVRVRLLDVRGAVVRTLADGAFAPGEHAIPWRDDGLAPGVYFVRMERPGGEALTRRVVVIR